MVWVFFKTLAQSSSLSFPKNGYFLPVSGLRAFHPSTSILCVNPSRLRPFVSSSSIHLGKVSEAMFSNPKMHFHGLNFKRSFPLYNYITRSGAGEDPSPARLLRFRVWNSRSGLHWYLLFAHSLRFFFLFSSSPARASCLRSMVHPVSSIGIHLQSPVRADFHE